ncbi:unnamed protein product [Dovyalis caffra]|uniref:Sulfotransferase n=1 Tax=Dovyalis caffra TaxID=77055 RepID=A0AAV1RM56_9ROSI|nr:unnamed protein product [Dovyalis caffra]
MMENTQIITKSNDLAETDEVAELLPSLPKETSWRSGYMYRYQGFWCPEKQISAVIAFQRHFVAHKTDTILVTLPKTGTTWLKALAFSIMNRAKYAASQNPLNSFNPHGLVPFFEYKLYANNQIPDLSVFPSPRIFATHVPYPSLPDSIKNSSCQIVYLCRNPFDTFISLWHFISQARPERFGPLSLEDSFDRFCNGVAGFGPFFDHVLGFWTKSLERPEKVLFLKFEDMKEDINSQLKRLAEFLGCPFSAEEERDGVIEGISKLCSFSNLKDKEANKTGMSIPGFENNTLFRRGEVGDWVNFLTPDMVDRLNKIMEQQLAGSGLQFKTCF